MDFDLKTGYFSLNVHFVLTAILPVGTVLSPVRSVPGPVVPKIRLIGLKIFPVQF